MHPLKRQWLIVLSLQQTERGLTVRQLAHRFRVSQKTIRRDLDLLHEVGFRVAGQEEGHGLRRWWIEDGTQ